jgi:hypothetical protein
LKTCIPWLVGLGAVLLASPLVALVLSWTASTTPREGEAQEQIQAESPGEWCRRFKEAHAATVSKLDAIQRDLVSIEDTLESIERLLELGRTEPWEDGR